MFGILEHEWGTRKHIDDLKKILMVHTSTKENLTYNLRGRNNARAVKSATVIFGDPKRRVLRLLESLTTKPHDDEMTCLNVRAECVEPS